MKETENAHQDLVRIAPSQNMARFYGISLQPTLFGDVAVVRCWGRIGSRGRVKSATYENAEQAMDVFAELERKKLLRSYITTNS